jgi:hypothetical protein
MIVDGRWPIEKQAPTRPVTERKMVDGRSGNATRVRR